VNSPRGFASLGLVLLLVIGFVVLTADQSSPKSAPVQNENVATTTAHATNFPSSSTADYVRLHGLLLITVVTSRDPFTGSIYTVHADGSGKKLVTAKGAMPSWTPDGQVIFISDRGGSPQIYLMDEDGGNARQIGALPTGMTPAMPQMGRDGTVAFMVFDRKSRDNAGIWVMRKDGSGAKEIARGQQPSLALSGTWIAYNYETENPYHRQIWRINTDGSNKKQLTFTGDPDYPDANAPNVSPDETMIACFSGKESDKGEAGKRQDPSTWGHRNVAIVPAEGGARRTITPCKPIQQAAPSDCVAADNPAWSPDSRWLLFDTDKGGVWMIDINGANMQQIYSQDRGTERVPLKYLP
jgi:Tol biopolymer transport system component